MKHGVYTVFDDAAKAHFPPFTSTNDAVAIRHFSLQVNDPESPIGRNPGDYTLVRAGEFDDVSGVVQGAMAPSRVVGGRELVRADLNPGGLFSPLEEAQERDNKKGNGHAARK